MKNNCYRAKKKLGLKNEILFLQYSNIVSLKMSVVPIGMWGTRKEFKNGLDPLPYDLKFEFYRPESSIRR